MYVCVSLYVRCSTGSVFVNHGGSEDHDRSLYFLALVFCFGSNHVTGYVHWNLSCRVVPFHVTASIDQNPCPFLTFSECMCWECKNVWPLNTGGWPMTADRSSCQNIIALPLPLEYRVIIIIMNPVTELVAITSNLSVLCTATFNQTFFNLNIVDNGMNLCIPKLNFMLSNNIIM